MIFNRWFWFSLMASAFGQSIQWSPAVADTTDRAPAIEQNILGDDFVAWIPTFQERLKRIR